MLPVITLLVATALPQVPIDVGPASTNLFSLDFDGKLANGDAGAVVTELEFEFQPPTGAPVLVRFPFTPVVGPNTVVMSVALKDVPGGLYEVRARWLDVAGQPSAFSEPPLKDVRNHANPPAAPGAVSVVDGSPGT